MAQLLRRLALGISLIILASGILLFFDASHRHSPKSKIPRIAVFQFASNQLLDDGVAGILDGLKERGYAEGGTIQIDRFNAQNDLPTANGISRQIVEGGYDLALTVSTPCLQSLAAVNRAGKVAHVFGLVTDPFAAGVGLNRERPAEHPRHLVGNGTFQPVRDALLDARRCYPALRRIGSVWNAGEASSEACMRVARATCKELGIELMEVQVENSTAVGEAASSLVARGAEAIFVGGDNTVEVSIQSVVKAGNQGRIPVIACAPGDVKVGVLLGLGADYREVGRVEGRLAAEILSGHDPASIPIGTVMPEKLGLNLSVLPSLAAKWQIPTDLQESAAIIVDANGKRRK
jgi:ABC-type uncharacterized transport system substrate-binding protein